MSPTKSTPNGLPDATEIQRAEAILHDLAAELRLVPLEEHTSHLHIRALELKREVARWAQTCPPRESRVAAIDELVELLTTTKSLRSTRMTPRW
jgi:hypothetical protein